MIESFEKKHLGEFPCKTLVIRPTLLHLSLIVRQRAPARRLNQSPDDVFEQLFDAYIRNGTVVRGALTLVGIPAFLKKKNSDELKIKVTNLELPTQNGSTEDYEQLRRFIDLKALRSVMMIENSAANKISSMLEKPEVSNVILKLLEHSFVDQNLRKTHINIVIPID